MLLVIQSANIFAQTSPTPEHHCVSGNCLNGKGKYTFANGDTYEGDFVKGKQQGLGKYIFKNGHIYTGQFAAGTFNGKGKLERDLFETLEGDFVNGKMEGQGTESTALGDVYIGQWKNGKYHGKGKLFGGPFDSEAAYEGDFIDGKRDGQGTVTYGDSFATAGDPSRVGDYYTGAWKNNLRNGFGKEYTKSTNKLKEGFWKDDVFVGAANPKPLLPTATNSGAIASNSATSKSEAEWKLVCEPFVTKIEAAVDSKKDDAAKQVYAEFDAATQGAGTSASVRNTRKTLLKTMHRSNSYPLMKFVRERLKTLNYNEEETKDILSPKLFYV